MGLFAPFVAIAVLAADDPLAVKSAPKLFKPVDITIESKPVGEFLKSFAAEHGLEIVIDPRVDVTAAVRGRFKRTFVERILGEAARFANARMVLVGEIVYVAPQESADRAAAAAFKARQALVANEKADTDAWKEKRAKTWDDEATAQTLVVGLTKDLGVKVKNPDDLDVKARAGSVKGAAADLLSAWTALADQTWSLSEDGKTLTIAPLPEDARLERKLRAPSAKEATRRNENYTGLKDAAVSSQVKGSTITLSGPWSALWAAERVDREEALSVSIAKTQKPSKDKSGKAAKTKRYDPTFKNVTLAQFAESIAEHTKKSVEIDEESLTKAGKAKTDRLNCVATGVDLEEMLALALEPLDLKFKINGDKIVIYAGK